jgi:hypothetical protein
MADEDRPRRVFLHVGSPKTGTTFLQQVLWSNHDLARTQGVLLPGKATVDHFRASLDLTGGIVSEGTVPGPAVGQWQRLVDEARTWDGDVLVTHELFAAARREHAESAVRAFGPEREVHVVVTARDLVRQVPAEWQERIKHRRTITFPQFMEDLRTRTGEATWFWDVHDYAALLERWGSALPPERVHVVTVPPTGADPGLLWERFAGLLRLDASAFDTTLARSNRSLGAEQVELLRRVNAALGERLPRHGPYAVDVRDVFAQGLLASRPGTALRLHPEDHATVAGWSREVAHRLAGLGVAVVGDLADLVPAEAPVDAGGPSLRDAVGSDVLLDEAVEALAGLLDEHRARRQEREALRRRLHEAETRLREDDEESRGGLLGRLRRSGEGR